MDLKKARIISVFGIFALSFLFHFLYEWFSNALFLIFFPINESIWEHMKLIFTSILFYSVIDYFVIKKLKFNNFIFASFFTSLISIPIYLIIYLPIYKLIGENMFISIFLLFIIIIISQIINYYILKQNDFHLEKLSIGLIILVYIIMAYLSYNPPKNYIFYDTKHEKYGLNTYNV